LLNNAFYAGYEMSMTPEDKVGINVPLYHTMGCVLGNLIALQFGSTMVYPDAGFDPVKTLEAATKEKLTTYIGVPTMYTATIAALEANRSAYDVSSFRAGLIAGSVVPAPLVHRISQDLQLNGLCVMYGMTELSPAATIMGPDAPFEKKVTTVGKCGPMTEIKIID
jgi:fatty-acyl-CoA synthase